MSDQSSLVIQTSARAENPKSKHADHGAPLTFDQVQAEENTQLSGNTPRTALCISGGGIRSATFALGALQGLADLGILEHFDYLSTVSGGGYIGSWLTGWKQRWGGLTKMRPWGKTETNVVSELESSAGLVPPGEIDPVQHLREYNNYLSPKLGFFSADTWTLAATVARNMLLNWLVFIPLLVFALMLPRILLSLARLGETHTQWYVEGADRFISHFNIIIPVTGGLLFAFGIFNVLRYLPSVGNKDHTQGEFLIWCGAPIFLAAAALVTTDAWFTGGDKTGPSSVGFLEYLLWIGGFGFLGWLAYLVTHAALWRKWKLILGLTVAVLLTVVSIAWAAWFMTSEHFRDLEWPVYVTIALPMLLLSFALAITIFVGLTSIVLEDEDREWLARAGAWILLTILVWAGFCALTLLAPQWAFHLGGWIQSAVAAAGGAGGVIAALAGFSSKTKAQKNSGSKSKGAAPQQSSAPLLDIAWKLAAPVFSVICLTALAVLTNWVLWKIGFVNVGWTNHQELLEQTRSANAVMFAVLCLIFSWLMAKYININKFSLNAMYRSRLIRAYLGASNEDRKSNPFTGFADNDNVSMKDLKAIPPDPCLKPFHIVNIALNLVSGERLAWQQRKAESFTVSPLHSGYGDCYRPAEYYGGRRGISLGTAVTISGAAASPNMGYHSSPAMTFIMTLFNARLGAWLGNPGQDKWTHEGPRSAFDSIVREAFGLTNDMSPYVYLSDGGHFENLAVYEMIRRHCRYIVVLDGGADPTYTYEDLGNALRKIRIDEKTSIQFEPPFLVPLHAPEARCAVATIHYHDGSTGQLVYVKPVVLGTEPPDVTAYKAANADFPHQSTANQWFDESQTESYRMLGLCSIKEVFKPWNSAKGFQGVVEAAREYLRPRAAAAGAGGK